MPDVKPHRKSFWTSKRIMTIAIIVFGIVVGMLAQHYYVEPLLGEACIEDLRICKAQNQVLNEENVVCYEQLEANGISIPSDPGT